jgi:hypothetical protein
MSLTDFPVKKTLFGKENINSSVAVNWNLVFLSCCNFMSDSIWSGAFWDINDVLECNSVANHGQLM